MPFETINSLSQQFWVGAEIPVGITDTNMPEVSRQDRQTRLNLVPATIPVQQCLHGKAVPEVVQTRSMARRWTAQPDLPRQDIERAVHITQVQSIARTGHEQMGCRATGEEAVASLQMTLRTFSVEGCRGTSRDLPNLVFWIVSTFSCRSRSLSFRFSASLMRRPETLRSPNRQ